MFQNSVANGPSTASVYQQPSTAPGAGDPVGHIVQHLQEQERLTLLLLDEIGGLEGRLTFVLRPDAPQADKAGSAPTPVTSTLAQGIAELNERLYRAVARVRSMTARVDM